MSHDHVDAGFLLAGNDRAAGDHRAVVPASAATLNYPVRMTSAAKMTAEPTPQMVRVRANLAAAGMRRGQEETVALTPMIQGALDGGKLSLVDEPKAPKAERKRKTRASGNGPV